ncbi:hypothetical protein HS125_13585 [bacterium]|nr:hypothetical protein [bacterium]
MPRRHRIGTLVGAAALAFSVSTLALAQDPEDSAVSVTAAASIVSKYLWHGYDVLDDHAAFQPYVEVGWRGFFVGVWGSFALASGFEDLDELDYYAGCTRSFLSEERFAFDAMLLYTYYDYPNSDTVPGSDGVADTQDLMLKFAFPNLISLGPAKLVPSIAVLREWDGAESGHHVDDGWLHILALSYSLPLADTAFTQEGQTLDVTLDATHNDGVFGSESGWSHGTLTLGTSYSWGAVTIAPYVAHQWSWEDSVNDEDEFVAGWTAKVEF